MTVTTRPPPRDYKNYNEIKASRSGDQKLFFFVMKLLHYGYFRVRIFYSLKRVNNYYEKHASII